MDLLEIVITQIMETLTHISKVRWCEGYRLNTEFDIDNDPKRCSLSLTVFSMGNATKLEGREIVDAFEYFDGDKFDALGFYTASIHAVESLRMRFGEI